MIDTSALVATVSGKPWLQGFPKWGTPVRGGTACWAQLVWRSFRSWPLDDHERGAHDQVDVISLLPGTGAAARALGISPRTLAHYAQTGQLEPALVLPSGYYKWDVEDIRRQLRELRRKRRADNQ